MHLVYLCAEYPPASHGGIGTFTRVMAQAMAARGHTVTVVGVQVGLPHDVDEHDGPVRVLRLRSHGRGVAILTDARDLGRTLRRVHAQQPIDLIEGPEGAFAFVQVPRGVPTVARLHGGHHFFAQLEQRPRRRWRAWAEARSLGRATHLCAVSRYVASLTAQLVPGLAGREVEVLHNPVDTTRFTPADDDRIQPGRVLFVGTLCEKKGVRELLQAFPAVAAAVPDAQLELVGRDGVDHTTGGSYLQSVRALVPGTLADRVHFTGALPHDALAERFARAAVYVFPSKAEALGIAALEAMAMGKACVVSARGPGAELVEHAQHGLLVEPTDLAALSQAIVELLQHDDRRRALGRAARARAETHFALHTQVERNEAFYARCIGRGP